MVGFRPSGIFGADDGNAIRRSAYVTQDQWQDTLSDAAETHKYDPARKIHMHFVLAHNFLPNLFFPKVLMTNTARVRLELPAPAYLALHPTTGQFPGAEVLRQWGG